ncbi:a1-alpha2 repression [Gryganskiella cystojenkinii]|nr:a1-alpha2 repression [Gryganskiella cystojenkinii]
MDNETMKQLFKAGAILLVLDAPQNQLEFGIDVNCWNTGPRFKGIKIIPPGPHFVYYSLHNTKKVTEQQPEHNDTTAGGEHGTVEVAEAGTTGGEVRIGFWHQFESGEVLVMKWNAYNEEMELEKDQEQVARYKAGIQEFDPFLGAYPLLPPTSTYPAWLKLANHINRPTIESIFVSGGFVDSHDDQLQDELSRATKIIDRQQKEDKEKTEAEERAKNPMPSQKSRKTTTIEEEEEDVEEEEDIAMDTESAPEGVPADKFKTKSNSTVVKFTPINLRASFRKGAVGEEVTRYSLDKSWLLNNLFTTVYKSGEYQAAFVTMLLSYHLGAFRQWKSMTILVCQSTEAVSSPNYSRLYAAFMQTLHHQLTSIPSSFFMDLLFASPDEDDMTANFLELALKGLGRTVQSGLRRGLCGELRKPMRALQQAVLESFEWKIPGDFKTSSKVGEIKDDAPMIDSDDDEDYEEEGEYAPVIVE